MNMQTDRALRNHSIALATQFEWHFIRGALLNEHANDARPRNCSIAPVIQFELRPIRGAPINEHANQTRPE